MTLPRTEPRSWIDDFDVPNRLFETQRDDYELYEEDDAFVLRVELPGYSPEEMTVTWDQGVLNVAAEREDDSRNELRSYHRRFRFPKTVDDSEISAEYNNGILEIRLPIAVDAVLTGEEIEIDG